MMEELIEKYGMKKVLLVILGVVISITILFFVIKKVVNGESKILECSKNLNLDSSSTFTNSLSVFKNKGNYKLVLKYNFKFNNSLSNFEENTLKNKMKSQLDLKFNEKFGLINDSVYSSYKYNNNGFDYIYTINVNKDNNDIVSGIFGYDIYELSVSELMTKIEEGGYKCVK